MKKIKLILMFLLGASLWIPGLAIINIGTWGLQSTTIIYLVLILLIIFKPLTSSPKLANQIIVNELSNTSPNFSNTTATNTLYVIHLAFIIGLLISTFFSSLGIDRSILSLITELTGVIFSFTLSWYFIFEKSYYTFFSRGFRNMGLLFSIYSIYQSIALKQYLPFSHITTNNASFSLVELEYAEFHGRSLGATAEPSILSSLILMMIGFSLIDVIVTGGIKSYLKLIIIFIGFLSTGSQAISVIPIYALFTYIFFRLCVKENSRKFNSTDLLGLVSIVSIAVFILFVNESIVTNISRVISPDFATDNRSAMSRSADMIVSITLFTRHPLFGAGLGGITELANKTLIELGLDSDGASAGTGFTRVLAEQGLVGIAFISFSFNLLIPKSIPKLNKQEDILFIGHNLSLLFSVSVSLMLFIGYRNLYHLWLLIPISLIVKDRFLKIKNLSQNHQ